MSNRRILYLDASGLSAYRRDGKQWLEERHFPSAGTCQLEFSNYLRAHRHGDFQLLADLAHEEILIDDVPWLRGKDRQALIARKLEQHFPARQFRLCTSQGRKAGMPQREKLLLASFTQNDDFTPWLHCLEAEKSRLSGIYSTSQLVEKIIQGLGQVAANSLLFIHGASGLRQYLLLDGKIQLCRNLAHAPEEMPERLTSELEKLRQYLLNHHLCPREAALPAYFFGESPAPAGFTMPPDSLKAKHFFLQALARHCPDRQFAPPALLQQARQARWQRIALLLGACSLLCSLPVAGLKISEATDAYQETERLLARINERQQQTSLNRQPSANTGFSAGTLTHLLQQIDELQATPASPRAAMIWLSRKLDQHPEIHLHKLGWQTKGDTLLIEGQFAEATGDSQPGLSQRFEQFRSALAVDRNREVIIRQSPNPSDNVLTLKGSSREANEPARQNFIVEISRQ